MKKYLFALILCSFYCLNAKTGSSNNPIPKSEITNTQYPDYYQSVEARYLSNTTDWTSDGANGTIEISNNNLIVNFDPSWTYGQQIATGVIAYINVYPALPTIELGPIYGNGQETGYYAKIEDNNLVVYTPNNYSGIYYTSLYFGVSIDLNCAKNWYKDMDGDGFGDPYSIAVTDCYQPNYNYVDNSLDCNDQSLTITQMQNWYVDADNDSYGDHLDQNPIASCQKPFGNYVSNNLDCEDSNNAINPTTVWYIDSDNDGFGDSNAAPISSCTKPSGNYVTNKSDSCPTEYNVSNNGCPVVVVNENYIRVISPTVASTSVSGLSTGQKIEEITYFDGLGRPMQKIGVAGGGNGEDAITHIGYDTFGRQDKEYLPYAETSNSGIIRTGDIDLATKNFYTAKYGNTTNPYSQKEFEPSPLNRVLRQAAPGEDWKMNNGHEIKLEYQTNIASDVKNFTFSLTYANKTYTPSLPAIGYYNANELYKTVIYDENTAAAPLETNGSTVEFKDKQGQVVLKRTYGTVNAGTTNEKHDTYYVYDDYGNLTFVIPPKASDLATAGTTVQTSTLNDLCYQYKYDNRNRMVEKKLPGKQWEFIVYDKLDRPVATGPALSPFDNTTANVVGWMVTKYDVFNRPVYTGWEQSTTVTSAGRIAKQGVCDAATVFNENKVAAGINTVDGIDVYYTKNITPADIKLLTVNYYDNYTFPGVPAIPTTVETQTVLAGAELKGLSTGSWTRVATSTAATLGETTAVFYDKKARPIRSHIKNHLLGETITDSELDFTGKPKHTITYHKRLTGSTVLKTKDAFTYTPQGRLLTQTHQINDGTVEVMATNTYDELGQLISKKVGNTIAAPVQKVDYNYNVRGWLTAINDINALSKNGDPKDLFAFKVNYNEISDVTKKLYNGNISQTLWATDNTDKTIKNYIYTYDKLNRLKSATDNTTYFNEDNILYDKNGNITKLKRKGHLVALPSLATPSNYGLMDDLTYTYDGGNRLQTVSDLGNDTYGFKDDVTGSGVVDNSVDYTYDVNGNMLTDANKGITTNIVYNHLNLPTKITFASTGNIVYIYNAAGQKVQKRVTIGTNTTVTDYLGGYQYVTTPQGTTSLKFFPTAEGYVEAVTASSYKYIYQYKDHLGNVRLSYDKNLGIQEENNYYPFGVKHLGYNSATSSSNDALKYKYNGKELQDDNIGGNQLNLYDYGARNYDPALGRWMNVDPLSELSRRFSPYTYANNNPVFFIDPDGMTAVGADGLTDEQWIEASRPGADPGLTKQYRNENRAAEIGRSTASAGVAEEGGFWNTLDKGGFTEIAKELGVTTEKGISGLFEAAMLEWMTTNGADYSFEANNEKIANGSSPDGIASPVKVNGRQITMSMRSSLYDAKLIKDGGEVEYNNQAKNFINYLAASGQEIKTLTYVTSNGVNINNKLLEHARRNNIDVRLIYSQYRFNNNNNSYEMSFYHTSGQSRIFDMIHTVPVIINVNKLMRRWSRYLNN